MNIQDQFSLGLTGLTLSKGFSKVFSSTKVQKHLFFGTQPSLWSNISHGVSSYKGINPMTRVPTIITLSQPNLPKAPSPNTITVGVRAPVCESWGTQSIVEGILALPRVWALATASLQYVSLGGTQSIAEGILALPRVWALATASLQYVSLGGHSP